MKKRAGIELAIWAVLTAAWAGVCMFLSWQTGDGTGKLSLAIARWLMRVLAIVGIRTVEAEFHMLLRECAHFGVFFVSGALFCGTVEALMRLRPMGRRFRAASALTVTGLAFFSDVPKEWIPGRHLTWSECALNAIGALTGYLLMLAVMLMIHKLKSTKSARKYYSKPGK